MDTWQNESIVGIMDGGEEGLKTTQNVRKMITYMMFIQKAIAYFFPTRHFLCINWYFCVFLMSLSVIY